MGRIDMSDYYSSLELINNQWKETQQKFRDEKFEYSSFEDLKTEPLYNWMFQVFDKAVHLLLIDVTVVKKLYRAAKEVNCDYDRFIPKQEFASNNRMNGKDKLYYYFGVSYKESKKEAITTCMHEIRVLDDTVAVCEFKLNGNGRELKIVDFTIDPKVPKTEADAKKYIKYHANRYGKEDGIAMAMAKMAISIFGSSTAFEPIDKDNISDEEMYYKYIPFWTITEYLQNQGYDGLLFNSTVYNNGKNLVLFDSNNAYYVEGSIEYVDASEFLGS